MRLLPDVVGGEPPRRGRLLLAAGAVAAAVIALAVLALFGLLRTGPGRAAEPAACPAQGIR